MAGRPLLDELPQLFNVPMGEMSLVGPRPPLPWEVERYQEHHRQRLSVVPGITGLWQVSGRSEITNFEEVVRLDLAYIEPWSLWLDFKILLKTTPVRLIAVGQRVCQEEGQNWRCLFCQAARRRILACKRCHRTARAYQP